MGAAAWRLVDALAVWGYAMSVYVPVSVSPHSDRFLFAGFMLISLPP